MASCFIVPNAAAAAGNDDGDYDDYDSNDGDNDDYDYVNAEM
jgi:hypothetical protein